MDEKIVQLFTDEKAVELERLLSGCGDAEVTSLIDRRITHGKKDPAALIRAVLAGSSQNKDVNNKRRLNVFKHVLSILGSQELNSQMTTELIGLLLFETDSLPAGCLSDLANHFVNSIKNGMMMTGKCLELFPKILSVLELQEVVTVGESEMKGVDFKSHILNSLCSGRWDTNAVIHLAAMFKDVSMSSDELGFVVNKILRMLNDVDLQELPPIIYQLLLLSTKGHKKLVLDGVISFFVEKDAEQKRQLQDQRDSHDAVAELVPSEQLHHIEGTAILHITFAIKQDQDLGREFIKCFKANQQFSLKKVLAPFNIALALSIGRIHSFEEQIFDLLKSAILRGFKDCEKQQESHWVCEMAPEVCDVAGLVFDTVKNSVVGWDHITQGLVQLGFCLMEAYGPKSCFGKAVESSGRLNPSQRACKLGSKLLLDTFKTHEMVRPAIIEQLLNHIVTKATNPVSHYLELLTAAVKSSLQVVMECVPKLRESFDYLAYLPMKTSEGLLRAIQPLLRISLPLRDSLLLVLRKAMFSRQTEARRVAVNGYLMLLNNFRALGGLSASQPASQMSMGSQVQVDVHMRMSESQNEALCLEILGNLRRCLSQQADVRLVLYEGLYAILASNLHMASSILSLLLSQFRRYYDATADGLPPVKLELCVVVQGDQSFTAEPLSHLMSCLVHCYLKKVQCASDSDEMTDGVEEDDDCGDVCKELETILNSLTDRMIRCELEDFELDKSAEFSSASSVGVRNTIFALLVCGIYEALMEYEFLAHNFEVERCRHVVELYQGFQKLSDILKDKPSAAASSSTGAAGKKKRGRRGKENVPASSVSSASAKYASLFSVRFVTELLRALFSDNDPAHQQSISLLLANLDLQCHVLSVAVSRLQQINQLGFCDGPEGRDPEKLTRYCMVLGKIVLKHFCDDLNSGTQGAAGNKQARSKMIATSCLEAFHLVISIFCNRFPNKLSQVLLAIDSRRASSHSILEDDGDQELIYKHIQKYQKLVTSILTSGDEDRSIKDVSSLMSVIGLLSCQLSSDNMHGTEVQDWLIKICKEQAIDDLSVTKFVVQQLLTLTKRQSSAVQIARDLARDIHIGFGDIDQDVEIPDEKTFAILSVRSMTSVLHLLLSHMEKEIEDTEWVICRLRAEAGTVEKSGNTQQDNMDKNICLRLGHTINIFHELLQTALPPGPCTESLIKTVNRLYAVLTNLVKMSLSLYAQKGGHISSRFEKLVKLSGSNLTQCVYSMITYIQASQTDQLQSKDAKTKKKGKKSLHQTGKAAQLLKESRFIPNLIYAIEQYEKFLIQLSKKSKIDLMSHFKMSTSRDFRINAAVLQTALEKEDTADESEEEDDDDNDDGKDGEPDGEEQHEDSESNGEEEDNNEAPKRKKAKLSEKQKQLPKKGGKKVARK